MTTKKSPRDYNAPDLVKQWKKIVNDNIMIGRDAHLFKEALLKYSPVQILLGMYRCKENKTITIPQFLGQAQSWAENYEVWAEIDLAAHISNFWPNEYYTYLDFQEEESSYAWKKTLEAKKSLREWSDKVLS